MYIIKYGDHRFYIEDTEVLAEITFRDADADLLVIEHTIISDKLKGQGVGILLIDKMVSHARIHRKKLSAECEYAAYQLGKNSKYHDVFVANIE